MKKKVYTIIVTNVVDLANYYNKYHIVGMTVVNGIGKDEKVVKIECMLNEEMELIEKD